MGIGLAAFIDKAGTGPSGNLAKRGGLHGGWESAVVRVHSDGKVTIFAGSHSHGQSHEITFCQIAADRLGLADRRYSSGRRRYRSDPVRQRHLGRALRLGGGDGYLSRRRQGHRQGDALCRANDGMRGQPTSNTGAASFACAAPTNRSVSPKWPTSPITARRCLRTARSIRDWRSSSSTIRPTPTIRRRCISRLSSSIRTQGA